jgi:hypothetical protein
MAILRCGQQLRLTSADADFYRQDTGYAQLPKTVNEYNQGLQDAMQAWMSTNCAEGDLMAAIIKEKII